MTYLAANRKAVDGGPSPAMPGWAGSGPHLEQLLLGVALMAPVQIGGFCSFAAHC
jgi:hypothetical protein